MGTIAGCMNTRLKKTPQQLPQLVMTLATKTVVSCRATGRHTGLRDETQRFHGSGCPTRSLLEVLVVRMVVVAPYPSPHRIRGKKLSCWNTISSGYLRSPWKSSRPSVDGAI